MDYLYAHGCAVFCLALPISSFPVAPFTNRDDVLLPAFISNHILRRLRLRSFGMDKLFHSTLYNG